MPQPELKKYFRTKKRLNETKAKEIDEECSSKLREENFSVQSLLPKIKVEAVCTTDDPADCLDYHHQLSKSGSELKMYPSFRPDKSYALDDPSAYNDYLDRLSATSRTPINSFDDLIDSLRSRIKFFNEL